MKKKSKARQRLNRKNHFYLLLIFLAALYPQKTFAQCSVEELVSSNCSATDNIVNFELAGVSSVSSCNDGEVKMLGDLEAGRSYSFGATNGRLKQWLAVWLDLDNDREYDYDEMVYTASNCLQSHSGQLTIPDDAVPAAKVAMRVRCKWGGKMISADQACTTFTWGETENFRVNLVPNKQSLAGSANSIRGEFELVSVYPNPLSSECSVLMRSGTNKKIELRVLDIAGRMVYTKPCSVNKGLNNIELDLEVLQPGIYMLQAISNGYMLTQQRLVKI